MWMPGAWTAARRRSVCGDADRNAEWGAANLAGIAGARQDLERYRATIERLGLRK